MKEYFLYPMAAIVILKLSGFVGKFIGEYEKISSFSMKEEYPAFNAVYRILFPVVVTFIMGTVFAYLGCSLPHLWLIPIYFCILKFIFIYGMGRSELANFKYIAFTSTTTILISFVVFEISNTDNSFFLPEKDDLISQFWIIILFFLYKIIDTMRIRGNSILIKNERLKKYIDRKTKTYIYVYKNDIKKITNNAIIIKIIISIMIVEDFNRPSVIRAIERKIPFLCKTTGIMQVKSENPLSDKESIIIGSKLIKKYCNEILNGKLWCDICEYSFVKDVAIRYNHSNEYADMVYEAYSHISTETILLMQ